MGRLIIRTTGVLFLALLMSVTQRLEQVMADPTIFIVNSADTGTSISSDGAGGLTYTGVSGGTTNDIELHSAVLGITGATTISNTLDVTGAITGNLTGNVTGNLTGNVTGDVTGNVSGSAGSVGAANLTGNTLAAGVTGSSLTSVGTLTSLGVSGLTTLSGGITADNFSVADTTGDTSIGGTLGVTGISTLTGALNANGGIAVDSTNFTVSGTTGAVATASTLDAGGLASLNGGLTMDSGVFTVADTTGNVHTSGTLDVDSTANFDSTLTTAGLTTLNGGLTMDSGVFTVADTTGDVHTSGSLDVDGGASVNSADTFTNETLGNNSIVLTADTDASAANAQSKLNLTATGAALTVNTNGGVSHGLNIGQTTTTLSGGTASTTLTLDDTGATVSGGTFALNNNDANATFSVVGSTGVATLGNGTDGLAGTFNITNAAGSNTIALAGSSGTATLGNGTSTAGTLNINSASSANTIAFSGSSATGTFGNATNAGTVYVTNGSGANRVALNGTGSSVIAGGASLYSGGTAAAGSGNRAIVDTTNARMMSSDTGAGNNQMIVQNSTGIGYTAANNSVVVDNTQSETVGLNSFDYGTRVNGGMYIDGSLGVNGNIYSLNNTANATVNINNNGMTITGATNEVALVADGDALDSNARGQLDLAPASANLLVNTDSGVAHGVIISQTNTVLSGGTQSTSMTLDDTGATFRNDQTGGPAKVTGVADGTSYYDAVNYGQLRRGLDTAYAGVASVAALAAIPAPVEGKNFTIGGGYGNFERQNAVALGIKARIPRTDIVVTAGEGYCDSHWTASAGIGISF